LLNPFEIGWKRQKGLDRERERYWGQRGSGKISLHPLRLLRREILFAAEKKELNSGE